MKVKLQQFLLALLLVLEAGFSFSQTIQLGTGTTTNGTTTSSPVNIWWRRTVAQFVYTAAELNAAGINGPCDLQDLGWFVTQAPIYDIPGYTVKLKHVTVNNVTNDLGNTGWSTVKGPFTYSPNATGWDMLGLDNSFTWNGVDNIGVELCWSQVQPSFNSSGQCRIYATANGYRHSWTDAAGNSCGLTPFSTSTNKPQVQMVWSCGPPCTTPAPPSVSGATVNCGDPATLTASGAPSNGDYIWYDDPSGTNQVGTGSSFTTPSLNGNTTYYVSTFVPANCESSLTAVTVNVNSNVPTPTANNITVDCGDPATFTATGSTGNYEWFSDANGNNSIGTGSSLNIGNIFSDTTVYVGANTTSQSSGSDVYNIDLNDLIGVPSGNSNTRYDCGNSNQGFQWADATPTGATITSITLEFKIGVECAPGNKSSALNNVAQSNFNSSASHCSLATPGPGSFITMSLSPGAYNIGGNNIFSTSGHSSCFGFERSSTLANNFARVTVNYTIQTPGCFSNLVPVTAIVNPLASPTVSANNITVDCGDPATFTATGSTGNYEWFSDANGANLIGTGPSLSLGNITTDTTVYISANSGGASGGQSIGFDECYVTTNWSLQQLNGGNGSVNTSGAPNSIQLTGPDGTGPNSYTIYQITVPVSGTISWSWNVSHNDCGFDTYGYQINGTDFPLATCNASGTTSVTVTAGATFAFYGNSSDGCCGTFVVTISDFNKPCPGQNCSSNIIPVTATVNPLASPTVSASPSVICENGSTTLTASGAPSNGDYFWYNDPSGLNQIGAGPTYTSGNLTTTTTFYVQTNDGSGSGNTASLTTTFAAGNGQNGNMFNVSILDNITIIDFDVHQYAGQTGNFEVYYKTGVYNGFESNAGAWALLGVANNITSSGFGNPTPLGLNLNLQLAPGNYAFYVTGTNTSVHYTNGTNPNNIYVQNNEIQFFEGVGKSYPFGSTFSPRIWNGTIHYEIGGGVGACFSTIESITINVDSQPNVPTILGSGSYCLGEEVTLVETNSGVAPGQLEWYENSVSISNLVAQGVNTITVVPSSTQDYILVANSVNGACPPATSSQATVTVPTPNNIIAPNNSTATCTVNQNGWVHLLDNDGRLIASINSLGQNLGSLSATMYEESSPILIEACNTPYVGYQTSVMDRHWVITPDIQPTQPVLVRLPFENTTLQSLIQESANNQNPNDDVGSINDVFLSKYSGPQNIDDDFENNCVQNGGSGNVQLFNQNFNNAVPTMSLLSGHSSTDLYAEFEIPNFSEFWLHGTNLFSPLPITLTRFEAECKEEKVTLNWETESEINVNRFEIEKSYNGTKWESIKKEFASGGAAETTIYSFDDFELSKAVVYYRLKQVDMDGEHTLHGPISANCKFDVEAEISIHPNPSNGDFMLNLLSGEGELGKLTIHIVSNTGKVVHQTTATYNTHKQQINFNGLNLARGAYLIQVFSRDNSFKTVKLIIT
jgi:hypothetical protein